MNVFGATDPGNVLFTKEQITVNTTILYVAFNVAKYFDSCGSFTE